MVERKVILGVLPKNNFIRFTLDKRMESLLKALEDTISLYKVINFQIISNPMLGRYAGRFCWWEFERIDRRQLQNIASDAS